MLNLDQDISSELTEEELNSTPIMSIERQKRWFKNISPEEMDKARAVFKELYGYEASI